MRSDGAWVSIALAGALLGACDSAADDKPSALSGGLLTVFDTTRDAFGRPAPVLDPDGVSAFFVGNSFFSQNWVTAPASTTARDGLGPTFNARACAGCHFKDGRGRPPDGPDETLTQSLLRLSRPGPSGPEPLEHYGGQFQPESILGVPAEGRVVVTWEEVEGAFPDGTSYSLRAPRLAFEDLAFGPFPDDVQLSFRVAPALVGMGLIDALDPAEIARGADPDDADGDGVSGRVNYAFDVESGERVVARFGWKAAAPTLEQQNAAAFLNDMGLTSSYFPDENCPGDQTACRTAPTGGEPEVTDHQLARVTHYTAHLGVPARRDHLEPDVRRGERLFTELGCASCHRPSWEVPVDPRYPQIGAQTIFPYSDFLLHDMGEGLADGRPDEDADGTEWRTPPLWGLGLYIRVNGHDFLLHDGRARGVLEAILWHGGEAEGARDRFKGLSVEDRARVIRFVESL